MAREVQPDTLTRDDAELMAREWLRLRRCSIGQRPLGPKDLADLILGARAAYAVDREVQPGTLTRDDAELVAREWLRLRRCSIGQRPLGPKDLADLILGTRAAYAVDREVQRTAHQAGWREGLAAGYAAGVRAAAERVDAAATRTTGRVDGRIGDALKGTAAELRAALDNATAEDIDLIARAAFVGGRVCS